MQLARDSIRQSSFDEKTVVLLQGIYDEVLNAQSAQTMEVAFAIADALSIMAGVGQKSPEELKRYAASQAHFTRFGSLCKLPQAPTKSAAE